MELLIVIVLVYILPMYVAYKIAEQRNRDTTKALFVTFFTGWLGAIGLWLGLKTRDKNGYLK